MFTFCEQTNNLEDGHSYTMVLKIKIVCKYICFKFSFIYNAMSGDRPPVSKWGRMNVMINDEPLKKWIVLITRDRNWQLMEDVNGMGYTE